LMQAVVCSERALDVDRHGARNVASNNTSRAFATLQQREVGEGARERGTDR